MNMRCFDQFHSLYVTVWQQTPEHLFQNLGSESRNCRKFDFPLKKYGGRFFSGSDETLKVAKNYNLGFACWLFFVAVRSHQQPMHGCNLVSSLLSNFFIGKDCIVQMFRKWRKNIFNFKYFLFIAVFLHVSKSIFFSKGQGTLKVE